MFSGSVARGVRQLTSQMNDHHRVQGNLSAEQDSAYDLLPCLLLYVKIFSHNFYLCVTVFCLCLWRPYKSSTYTDQLPGRKNTT